MKSCAMLAFGVLFAAKSFGQLTSTNLPIVLISTPGAISTTQIQGSISIIDNASGVNTPTDAPKFTGMIGINQRGNTTYPKSSYSVETWSATLIAQDTSLLGLPSENDWVLMSAYEDRSLMRSSMTFNLHQQMGRYAPRMKYCEVLVNNQYQGIYMFGEKIKRDSLRLDIARLTNIDNSGIDLTGGYIWRIDGGTTAWTSLILPPYASTQTIKFTNDYPSAADITPTQSAYIKAYTDSFETALNATNFQDTLVGWRRFGAVNSFIDYMIVQEVSRNFEAYRTNTYLYKDKGTKMRPGPMWNFELAWKNTVDCNSGLDTGWCYQLGAVCGAETKLPPFWWSRFMQDNMFVEDLKCRYTFYRKSGNPLDTAVIFHYMDSVSSILNQTNATGRNFTQYPIWGTPLVNEPTPMATNHAEEVNNMKSFIKARIAWLDTKWITTNIACPAPEGLQDVKYASLFSMYPNPANSQIFVTMDNPNSDSYMAELISMQGSILHTQQGKGSQFSVDLQDIPSGMYMLRIKTAAGSACKRIIKE